MFGIFLWQLNKYKLNIILVVFLFILSSCTSNDNDVVSQNPVEQNPPEITYVFKSEHRPSYAAIQTIWQETNSIQPNDEFSVNNHYILRNSKPFLIKGMVYVPGYPGFVPWEIEYKTDLPTKFKNSILRDFKEMSELGANTIRLWHAPKYCYEALKEQGDLYFIQTIWMDGEHPDFQDVVFKTSVKSNIKQMVDRIYSVYVDNNPPIVAFLLGNELSRHSIQTTDNAHPEINSYIGNYFSGNNLTATEAFLTEMADYLRTYEIETYGKSTLISYANEVRTEDIIDTPFLDFRSHNVYSYGVEYFRPSTKLGSNSGTIFQGYIEELKSRYPNKPLLITETGLSVSPNAAHIGPPNYGYGGNTEDEQLNGLLQNLNDIKTSAYTMAGVCIHEYLDAWWKFGLEDSYSQDPDDIEEWFGLVKITE